MNIKIIIIADLREADTGKKLPPLTPCICTDVWCWNWKRKSESLDKIYLNIFLLLMKMKILNRFKEQTKYFATFSPSIFSVN